MGKKKGGAKKKKAPKKGKGQKKKGSKVSKKNKSPKLEVVEEPKEIPLKDPMPMIYLPVPLGDYRTLLRLLREAFLLVDRVFCRTPYSKYIIFEVKTKKEPVYYLYDGCICNPMRFRYFDMNGEKSTLKYYPNMHSMLEYIVGSQRHKGHVIFPIKPNWENFCSYR